MKCRIDDAESLLADATKTWAELEEIPDRLDLQQSIQNIENVVAAMKEEVKSLGSLTKMKKMIEMNRLQQEAQRLREKQIQFNDMLQPYQEQIAELVYTVEQKVKEFTTSRSDTEVIEDSSMIQSMLETAQECVEAMNKEVTGLQVRFIRASQEAKEKLQQEKPAVSGSRTSHK